MGPGEMFHGKAALHPLWPQARWNVSGLFIHERVLLDAFLIMLSRYDCPLPIETIHGAPSVAWNSGRVTRIPPRLEAFTKVARVLNQEHIGVYLTFSNHLLEPKHLDDPICNQLLEIVDNGSGLNGVILASDLLYDYIHDRHPKLKLTSSIVKVTMEDGRGNADYYHALSERFDSVMLHPDDGFDLDLLAQLDRDKTEVLVNENCAADCTVRKEHYELMATQQLDGSAENKQATRHHETTRCPMPSMHLDGQRRSCNFSTEETKAVYDLGFRRFKLQGRADTTQSFAYDILRFMLEPGRVGPVVLKAFLTDWGTAHGARLMQEMYGIGPAELWEN